MLSINCIRCAFGPGSIASRGLLFGAETVSRIRRSEWDALQSLKWNMRSRTRNGAAAQFCVRTGSYTCCDMTVRETSGKQRREAQPCQLKRRRVSRLSIRRTLRARLCWTLSLRRCQSSVSAVDCAMRLSRPAPSSSITTATLWASSRSLYRRNLPKALRSPSASSQGYRPWAPRWPIRSTW